MRKFIFRIIFIGVIALNSGCMTYHEAVQINQPAYPHKFDKTLIYEGVIFKAGLYFQADPRGNIKKGFSDTFRENLLSSNLFEQILLPSTFDAAGVDLGSPENVLSMKVYTNLLNEYKPIGPFYYIEMTAGILIFETGTRKSIYAKQYYIKRPDYTLGLNFLWKSIMKDLVDKVLSDIAEGDFDNPNYRDIEEKLIEL